MTRFSFRATADQLKLGPGDRADVAFTPQINEFRGVRSVQLQVCDLRPAPTRAQAERSLFERLQSGGAISALEAQSITPTREEFEAVWRYLKRHASPTPLEDHPTHLTKSIAKTLHLREAYARTMVCIQVFDERGLIRVEQQTAGRLRIGLCRVEGKVDLEQSELLRRAAPTDAILITGRLNYGSYFGTISSPGRKSSQLFSPRRL